MDKEVMKRKPRSVKQPMINSYLILQVTTSAAVIVIGTLFIFWREVSVSFSSFIVVSIVVSIVVIIVPLFSVKP